MVDRHSARGGVTGLRGRRTESAALDELLAAIRDGESRALVVRGEAGVGKTALLEYLVAAAPDLRVERAMGVESEMELAFAALHQLCAPMLARLERLPAPQREALEIVFGLSAGAAPDRFLIGLAVLSLLSDVAEEHPLLCVVDDAQWLDEASAQVLAFVARRLGAEPVGLVFSARESSEKLRGIPELEVEGLGDADARELLSSALRFLLDERVRDRIVAETRGNPLALLELPRGLTATQLAGGFGLLAAQALSGRIEESFRQRLGELPSESEQLLLVAAAEPVGDPLLLWRAAERLGVGGSAAVAAETEGLLAIDQWVTFRHPLVRSAVYRSASLRARQAVHLALAEVTDPEIDPDRRAWHLAAAASGPDEEVAVELERSAGRAQARGGIAAAAAFLQRSVALTQEPARRAERALAAAQANLQAGAFDAALELLATAESGSLNELQRAWVILLHGQIASATSDGGKAPALLLKAAKRLEPLDVTLARETYLDAWGAALFAGRLAIGGNLLDVSQAARSAPQPTHPASPSDLLLDGLSVLITGGPAAGAAALRQAVSAFRGGEMSVEKGLQWAVLASSAAVTLWDFESSEAIITRQVGIARDAGALTLLAIALNAQGMLVTWGADFPAAASVIAEADAVTEATGTRIAPYGAMLHAAFRGREAEASTLIEATIKHAIAGGEGLGVQYARWAKALLYNGLGRYEEALAAAEQAREDTPDLFLFGWALPELIEATVRSGMTGLAAGALGQLAGSAQASGADWGLGLVARSRALLTEGEAAELLYLEAIKRLARTRVRPELARAHLLYGEWLRREGRRVEAREQLRTAHDMLVTIGMEAFAERARRELAATGVKARKRTVETRDELTAQEEQIARLARDGLSNPEIGGRLFISPRTVEWHLRKVFTKLGISSRRALDDALPRAGHETTPA
jgi:DNA-binding CsgD family transcriptional regulator/tetratricopeptide (TPR) repeat protein